MKVFLASDALDDVRWATARGLIDGVVLPDAALDRAPHDTADAWLRQFAYAAGMPVFVAIDRGDRNDEGADAGTLAERLGRTGDNVVVQVPWSDANAAVIHRLSTSGVRVAATFIATAAQALLAAKAGAAYLFLDVDRIEVAGGDAALVVRQCRDLLDRAMCEADLVAVFPRSGASFVQCGLAGVHATVLGTAALRALLRYPLADPASDDGTDAAASGVRLRVDAP